jgi:hypothetical protein
MGCVLFIMQLNIILQITAYSLLFWNRIFNTEINGECHFSFRLFALRIFISKNRHTNPISKNLNQYKPN